MKSKVIALLAIVGTVSLATDGRVEAGTIVTFIGSDPAAPIGGFPFSSTAQTAFLAAASVFGPLSIPHTFEALPVGFQANNSWLNGDGTFTLAGSDAGSGLTGVTNTNFLPTCGNACGFNVNPGGANYLGMTGVSVTFNNTVPTHSFGFFLTGIQDALGNTTVTFNDGANQSMTIPDTLLINGGAQYFGFTDTDPFSSVTIARSGGDIWGIDVVRFNVSPVPGPIAGAGLPGLVLAFGGVLAWWRRRTSGGVGAFA